MATIVPKFTPKVIKSKAPSNSGAAALIGAMGNKYRTDVAYNLGQQRIDIARERLNIQKAKPAGKLTPGNIVSLYNSYTSKVSAENRKRIDNLDDPLPVLKIADWASQELGVDISEIMPSSFKKTQQPGPGAGYMMSMTGLQDNRQGASSLMSPQQRPVDRQALDRIVNSIPTPKPIVHEKLPKLNDLLMTMEAYDDADTALQDLLDLDNELMSYGLDLADVPEIQTLVEAFGNKFGQEYAQRLINEALTRRQ